MNNNVFITVDPAFVLDAQPDSQAFMGGLTALTTFAQISPFKS
jgi:hypothetical protein